MSTPEERFEKLWRNRWGHATDCLPMKPILLKIYLAATEDAARIAEEILPELEPEDCCFAMIVGTAAAIRGE